MGKDPSFQNFYYEPPRDEIKPMAQQIKLDQPLIEINTT